MKALAKIGGLGMVKAVRALVCAAAITATALTAVPAMADSGRDETTPTGWYWYHSQPASVLNNLVANGQRPVSLKRSPTSPSNYDFATVSDSGVYNQTFWYYYNVTPAQVSTYLSTNNARLISLDTYDAGSSVLMNVVMVANTGANNKSWYWYYGLTSAEVMANCSANNSRLVDLQQYDFNGSTRYSCVMVRLAGEDNLPWGVHFGATEAQVNSYVSSQNMRIIDLQVANAAGTTFNAIYERNTGQRWYWWFGQTDASMNDLAGNKGCRIFDCQSYSTAAGTRYAALMMQNGNALTERVGGIMRGATDGDVGCYIKQVNGSVLANLQKDRVFEPASMIKVLHHTHAMHEVYLNHTLLTTTGNVFLGISGSCPQDTNGINEQLQTSLRLMMENSDNNRTQAMRARFGEANINATAQMLGATDTLLQHRLGCAGGVDGAIAQPNHFTLDNAGNIYEAVATGFIGSGSLKQTWYDLMLDSEGNGFPSSLTTIINEEAAAAGLPSAVKADFVNLVRTATKGGNYSLSSGGPSYYHQTRGGWVKLPIKSSRNCGTSYREYVLGTFVNNASVDANASTAAGTAFWELTREQVRSAINSWVVCVGRCPADLDDGSGLGRPDAGVTLEDLLYFLNEYNEGSVNADLDDGSNQGNPDGGVGIEDLLFFLRHYDIGC